MFKALFQSGKDAVLSQVLRVIVENQIKEYQGTVQHFALDTSLKTIKVDVLFEGEEQLVCLLIKYEPHVQDGKSYLRILEIQSNRGWIGLLLSDLLKRGMIPATHELPPIVAQAI
jgi:hypothetical protein